MLLLPQAAHYTPLNKNFNGVDRTSISLGKHLTGQAKTSEMNIVKLSRNKDWSENPRISPIVTIFILFDKEMPDEERSRGIVMNVPSVIETGIKRKVAFSSRQTNLPSTMSGLEKGMGPIIWLALTVKNHRIVS